MVYASTASPELVTDGCGFAVPPGDVEAVLDSIRAVKQAGKQIYAEKCISFARENFDKNQNIAQYLAVYRELLS